MSQIKWYGPIYTQNCYANYCILYGPYYIICSFDMIILLTHKISHYWQHINHALNRLYISLSMKHLGTKVYRPLFCSSWTWSIIFIRVVWSDFVKNSKLVSCWFFYIARLNQLKILFDVWISWTLVSMNSIQVERAEFLLSLVEYLE